VQTIGQAIGQAFSNAAFVVTTGCALVLANNASAQAAQLNYRCVNSASGAAWTLTVNDANRTADGFPADISSSQIAWRDTTSGGRYQLDRASGELTFSNASSMGGYMLFHRCQEVK
jgi:hypothetical protein